MTIIRKSPNFRAFLQATEGVEPDFAGCDEVSLGFRQVERDGIIEQVEVKGEGPASYSIDWLDDWGAPPSESDLDAWKPEVPVEVPSLSAREKALLVKEAVEDSLLKLFGELAEDKGVDEAAQLIVSKLAKVLK